MMHGQKNIKLSLLWRVPQTHVYFECVIQWQGFIDPNATFILLFLCFNSSLKSCWETEFELPPVLEQTVCTYTVLIVS